VAMMRRIAQSAEEELFRGPHLHTRTGNGEYLSFEDALSRAAAQIAEDLNTIAIVAFTHSGATARLASKCRPRVPVLAATPLPATARWCTLYWGVRPVIIEPVNDTDEMLEHIERHMRDHGLAAPGDVVVVTAGTPVGRRGSTNLMRLLVVG
jgi:pyruvate kinase